VTEFHNFYIEECFDRNEGSSVAVGEWLWLARWGFSLWCTIVIDRTELRSHDWLVTHVLLLTDVNRFCLGALFSIDEVLPRSLIYCSSET
jgi:hypothetical protein